MFGKEKNKNKISNFELENVRDRIKERKFEEKKQRFDKYVEHVLPGEINEYLRTYFNNNFLKLKKDVDHHQQKINKELQELRDFTQILKKGEERTQRDM